MIMVKNLIVHYLNAMAEEKHKKARINPLVLGALLFIIFYALLYAASVFLQGMAGAFGNIPVIGWFLPFPGWISPMFFVMPLAGYFIIYLLVDWVNEYFKTQQALSVVFPVVFFVAAIFAYYIALTWYAAYVAGLTGRQPDFDLWNYLRNSAYYLFVLGGLLGWLARYIVEKAK